MTPVQLRSRTTRWLSVLAAIALIAASMLIPVTSAAAASKSADMVLEWNLNAVNAIGNASTATPPGLGQPPPPSVIHLAMVHGAMYDAVMAIVRTHEPYLDGLRARRSASQAAAVAAAAHGVLVGLTPKRRRRWSPASTTCTPRPWRRSAMARPRRGASRSAKAAAAAMLADRVGDGRFGPYMFPTGDRSWRVAPRAPGDRELLRVGEPRQAVHAAQPGPVPHRAAVRRSTVPPTPGSSTR